MIGALLKMAGAGFVGWLAWLVVHGQIKTAVLLALIAVTVAGG